MFAFYLRHGESVSNAAVNAVALPEDEGDRLSDLGKRQAKTAAEFCAEKLDPQRIICSPMRRAQETAAPIAELTGLEPEIWDWIYELRESDAYMDMSADDQQTYRWSNRMAANADDPHHSPGGGESFAGLLERVKRTQAQLAADDIDRTLLVGHGIFFRFTFALTVFGEDFTPHMIDRLWRIGSLNCGLSTFQHTQDGASPNPADIDGWRCVSWMAPTVGPDEVTGTGGGGAGN